MTLHWTLFFFNWNSTWIFFDSLFGVSNIDFPANQEWSFALNAFTKTMHNAVAYLFQNERKSRMTRNNQYLFLSTDVNQNKIISLNTIFRHFTLNKVKKTKKKIDFRIYFFLSEWKCSEFKGNSFLSMIAFAIFINMAHHILWILWSVLYSQRITHHTFTVVVVVLLLAAES